MPKPNLKFREYIWTILCISIILLNGCKLSELNKAKSDDTNIKKDKTAASRDKPLIKKSKEKEVPPAEQGSGYLSKGSTLGLEIVDKDEELEALKKIKKLETRLETERNKMNFQIETLIKKISDLQASKEVPPAEQGSGYLSKGSALGLGMVDGDEELKVLKKIKIIEARLKALRNEMRIQTETSNKKLSDLQTAKEGVEKDLADTKKRLEKENKDLSVKIKALESKLSDTEARAVTAEKKLEPVKERLLKAQLSEIKAEQELYKLKIDNLKQEEE
jgi:hypothetical protein